MLALGWLAQQGVAVSRTAARRDALRATAAERGLDAVLVTNLLNVRYLTGFTGSNGALLVRTDGADLFGTDGRYTTQAGAQVPDVELLVDRATVGGAGPGRGRSAAPAGSGYESHDLTVDGLAALEKVLADAGRHRAGAGVGPPGGRGAAGDQGRRRDRGAAPGLRGRRPGAGRARRRGGAAARAAPSCEVGRELDARMLDPRAPRRRRFETIVATGAELRDPAPPARRDGAARRRLPEARLRRDRRRLPLRHDAHRRPGARRRLAARDLRAGRRLAGGRPGRAGGRRRRRRRRRGSPRGHRRRPATATTSPTASGTASAWRSTRRRASGRSARVRWPPAWPSPWSRVCTYPATAVSASRTR